MTKQISQSVNRGAMAYRSVASAAQSGQSALTFRDVQGILRRRMWLIIIITVFCIVTSVVLWFVFKTVSPRYTSTGFILCKMPIQAGVFGAQSVIPRKDVIAMETASNAAILGSDSFLSDLLRRSAVQQTDWFRKRENDPEQRLKDLRGSFSASPRRETAYVMVRMSAATPKEAKLIVDEALSQFVTQKRNSAEGSLREDLQALVERRNQLEADLKRNQEKLVDITRRADVPGWQAGAGKTVVIDELRLLNENRLILEEEIGRLRITRAQIQQAQEAGGYSASVQMAIEQDPMVTGYRTQIANLTQQHDTLIRRFGQSHRQVQDLQATIEISQGQLTGRETLLREQYATQETGALAQQELTLIGQLSAVNGKYEEVSSHQRDLDQKVMSYVRTQEEKEDQRHQLAEIEREVSSVNVKLRAPDRVTVEVVPPGGVEPLERSFPKLTMFFGVGVVFGLLISVGLAFLLEFIDDSVKTPSDVLRHLNVPLLGMIPVYEGQDGQKPCDIEKVAVEQPHSLMSEFYRKVRTNLFFSAPAGEIKVLLVTGCSADCGSTTTAVNLAITMSEEGKRVLLMDGNFRRPALNRLFPVEGSHHGLSSVLVGQVSVADAVRPSGIKGLDLIDSGPLPPNPSDLLNSQQMRDFLDGRKEAYDYVIIDGPPSLVVTDAQIIAGLVDGTIIVVHAENTSRGEVQRMIREVGSERVRLLGVVLNAVQSRKGGYFEKAYRDYYEYVENA